MSQDVNYSSSVLNYIKSLEARIEVLETSEQDLYESLGIGSANKMWCNMILAGHSLNFTDYSLSGARYQNRTGNDGYYIFEIPLPLVIGTYNLVITRTKIGISDADANDYVDRLRWYGWTTYNTTWDPMDSGVGQGLVVPIDYTWNHTDFTVGGVVERLCLLVYLIVTTDADLDISFVQFEYYYA